MYSTIKYTSFLSYFIFTNFILLLERNRCSQPYVGVKLATCKEDELLLLEIRKTVIHFETEGINRCEEKEREENAYLFDRDSDDSSWTEIYSTKNEQSRLTRMCTMFNFISYKAWYQFII